jgi:hypothetical protein
LDKVKKSSRKFKKKGKSEVSCTYTTALELISFVGRGNHTKRVG